MIHGMKLKGLILMVCLFGCIIPIVACANRLTDSEALIDTSRYTRLYGAIVRGDISKKEIALVFTGDEFADGGMVIARTLKENHINASFFLTGRFYRNKEFRDIISTLIANGNYMGVHSDMHLLYCDWKNRDSLLVTHKQFTEDLENAYGELRNWKIKKDKAKYFLPPYEWYNNTIANWTSLMGLRLVNFSAGTRSNADYTYPEMAGKYVDSERIYKSIVDYERSSESGLNGFLLLVHIGTDVRRKDKFYDHLPKLISELKEQGYKFVRIDDLLN
jgi:endoglucanase